ncbi:Very-long-chain 3-oxoacyl-CoA synthase protein [Dioscorea alata]|uniref:Very-long-chain 3-oxoacyl-CoA synthase protein n=1 Tax=Dioscorea alata TaxID=55571 RepID=A0ACB7TVH9_DIOAL|nr:Very-long-chain 3-oxoacyl-CoA synthase protein [Dioscorea alata]
MKLKSLLSIFTPIQLLQASFFTLLALSLTLHAILSFTPTLLNPHLLLLSQHKALLFSFLYCIILTLLAYLCTRPRPVYLLNYSCFKPDHDRKCSYEVCEYFVRRSKRFSDGMITAVDSLLSKTNVSISMIDTVIVTCGMFTPSPSLASLLVNHYKLGDSVKSYNLSGMGCSSGAAAVDLAARLLRSGGKTAGYALVVVTESISLNWYFGDDRSMLVTNCIFRVGCAAALMTNDGARRRDAKLELLHSLRTHHGADDSAYAAAYQAEDTHGNVGVALKKDLIRVAGEGLRSHIKKLAPRVLPVVQLVNYGYRAVMGAVKKDGKPHVPDFTTAFEHMCVHTGGKAVIETVGRLMRLSDDLTEPARMCLHRFGNTSSSLVFYELAYFEAKNRVKKGDRVWMLAFGTGFKVCSLVWKSLQDSCMDADNPWMDCIHRYPVKTW